jgi:hypothetical protein
LRTLSGFDDIPELLRPRVQLWQPWDQVGDGRGTMRVCNLCEPFQRLVRYRNFFAPGLPKLNATTPCGLPARGPGPGLVFANTFGVWFGNLRQSCFDVIHQSEVHHDLQTQESSRFFALLVDYPLVDLFLFNSLYGIGIEILRIASVRDHHIGELPRTFANFSRQFKDD